ncbi:FAD-binding domain-containing protein [Curvibacter sp. RS43]|uniref:FAD-binding domain-containing protein n=1 Tax=Curvibacter microcysteis TaxID=3026419 RepID=UPI0023626E8C|nr:FAD-binding domain-containing protein [Curvibacter sp. RS43]MDD0809706.1 FAD-binding domain-containing protein [Curvibacter sp. RS43]
MSPNQAFAPTLSAAASRLAAVDPEVYARTRNHLAAGATGLGPYLTHGLLSIEEVLRAVTDRYPLQVQDKLVFELGWRAYYRHVWAHRGAAVGSSIHPGPLPETAYALHLPSDLRQGVTGVPVIDQAVRCLYDTGYLHNHARLWLASYVVHVRKVHWRVGADWLYSHLLDGDLASNFMSWQWVAGTSSSKPYLFNAENVARFAPGPWHSPGSVIDTDYETLDRRARDPAWQALVAHLPEAEPLIEPDLACAPPAALGFASPRAQDVAGRDVWLIHPWSLGALPKGLPDDVCVLALSVADFHHQHPWSERRWHFVGQRMAELTPWRWHAESDQIAAALGAARRVRCMDDPHSSPWLTRWAECQAVESVFAPVAGRCDSFSAWWKQAVPARGAVQDTLLKRA